MIAIVDDVEKNVYFISNGVRKMTYLEASDVLSEFIDESIPCVFAKQTKVNDLLGYINGNNYNNQQLSSQAAGVSSASLSDYKYIVPSKPSAVIVAGLSPPLMFENGYDYKSLESIKNSYGGTLPHQVEKLINSGRLIVIDESAISDVERKKQESIKIAQRKHKNGGKKVDSEGYDSDDEDDRLLRKATRINL